MHQAVPNTQHWNWFFADIVSMTWSNDTQKNQNFMVELNAALGVIFFNIGLILDIIFRKLPVSLAIFHPLLNGIKHSAPILTFRTLTILYWSGQKLQKNRYFLGYCKLLQLIPTGLG